MIYCTIQMMKRYTAPFELNRFIVMFQSVTMTRAIMTSALVRMESRRFPCLLATKSG